MARVGRRRVRSGAKRSGEPLRPKYDFSKGRRNKYAARYARGSNVVVLDPDVAAVFPNASAVNAALRALAGVIRQHRSKARANRSA